METPQVPSPQSPPSPSQHKSLVRLNKLKAAQAKAAAKLQTKVTAAQKKAQVAQTKANALALAANKLVVQQDKLAQVQATAYDALAAKARKAIGMTAYMQFLNSQIAAITKPTNETI